MNHHLTLAPSSVPAVLSCACFESHGDGDRDSDTGSEAHRVLAKLSGGEDVSETTLELDLFESCLEIHEQAMAFGEDNCPGAKFEIEQRVELKDNTGNVITFGTVDLCARNEEKKFVLILDWKACLDFEPDNKDYKEQLEIYALAKMREYGYDKALCVEAFISVRKLRPYWVTYQECVNTIECAIARREDPRKVPQANDYCKWCAHILNCPAINCRIGAVTELFCDMPKPEKILNPKEMTAAEMSVALTFARATMKKYIKKLESVCAWIEEAALEMSNKGNEIPHYDRTIEAGKKEITDIDKAFRLSGLTQEDFFSALKLSLPKLAEACAKSTGMKKKDARKEIEGRLNEVIVIGEAKAVLERSEAMEVSRDAAI
jgi:hypothetical protein